MVKASEPRKRPRDVQDKLRRLQDEVEALRSQLRRSQRLASLGTMTAMVAHEFNNILTPIISYAELAQSNPGLATKAIERAASGGHRASTICRALLGMTREDAATQQVRLRELVEETLSAMARDPGKDNIELTLDITDNLELSTRRIELQQVLMNLILNARQAVLSVKGVKRIVVSAEQTSEFTNIRVSDTGVGIAPEHLPNIFRAFYTTNSTGGHGLGLAICKEIVEDLGGRINVESKPGHGTTFSVRLPVKIKASARLASKTRAAV